MEVCRGPECVREVDNVKRGLCRAHAAQEIAGKELHPLGFNRGGANRKYKEGDECKVEGCTTPPKANWMCDAHNAQIRKYGHIRQKGGPVMTKGFSTQRWCEHCRETMDWRKYHLEQNMCTNCYRLSLSREVEILPGNTASRKNGTMQDLLNFIDAQL